MSHIKVKNVENVDIVQFQPLGRALLPLHRLAENSRLLNDNTRQSSVSHYTEIHSRNVKTKAGILLIKASLIK